MENIYENKIRHSHYNPYSGGGGNAGHEGSGTVSGVREVHLEILERDPPLPQGERLKIPKLRTDPYARRCDFGNEYKAVN